MGETLIADDEQAMKKIESEYHASLAAHNDSIKTLKAKQSERLKQRRAKLRAKRKAAPPKHETSSTEPVVHPTDKVLQSKSVLQRLGDIEDAVKQLLGQAVVATASDQLSGPNVIATETSLARHMDDLARILSDEEDDVVDYAAGPPIVPMLVA